MTDAATIAKVKRLVAAVNGYPIDDAPAAPQEPAPSAPPPPVKQSPAPEPVAHHDNETSEPSADAARRRIDAYVAAKFGR